MSRETIFLIFAGLAALIGVPMIYMGLQTTSNVLVTAGFLFFTLGMVVSPLMRLCAAKKG